LALVGHESWATVQCISGILRNIDVHSLNRSSTIAKSEVFLLFVSSHCAPPPPPQNVISQRFSITCVPSMPISMPQDGTSTKFDHTETTKRLQARRESRSVTRMPAFVHITQCCGCCPYDRSGNEPCPPEHFTATRVSRKSVDDGAYFAGARFAPRPNGMTGSTHDRFGSLMLAGFCSEYVIYFHLQVRSRRSFSGDTAVRGLVDKFRR
jgi:hypothetical protein